MISIRAHGRKIASLALLAGAVAVLPAHGAAELQDQELVVLVDSSKFKQRSSLILCGLKRISTVITDSGLQASDVRMLEEAGVSVIIADAQAMEETGSG